MIARRGPGAVALLVGAVLAGGALGVGGCGRPRATADDCRAILDRIVELELRDVGFRDPVLAARRRAELRRSLAGELAGCEGRRLPPGALDCVRVAASTEEISHRCLR